MELKPGYKQTEVGVIPEDWDVSTVGKEFEIKLGKMLDAEKNTGVPKPYLGNKAVQWGHIDVADLPTVPMTRADIESYRLRKGDLLVCEGGEVGRAAIWHGPIDECYYQKAIHRLRALHGFEPSLMVGLLRRWSDSGRLLNYVTKTSIAHLPREKFLAIPMPVPPPAEQRLISAVLCDLDALLAQLDGLLAKKRSIKEAAMQELLTGKRRLPGFEGEWEVKRLGDFADCTSGGTPSTGVPAYWGGSLRWMSSGELHLKRVSDVAGRITTAGLENSSAKLLPPRCVLIGLAGQGKTRGTAALSLVELSTNQSIAAILPNSSFDSEFLYHCFDSRYDELRELSSGSGGRGGLNLSLIKSLSFRMPTIIEQSAISSALSDIDLEIANFEKKAAKARELKQGMMQQLLTGKIRLK